MGLFDTLGTVFDATPFGGSQTSDLSALTKAYADAKSDNASGSGPNALFGPPTYPTTQAPTPAGLPAPAAPANPVSDGGYNAIDAQAGPAGPTSVGGAPLPGGWQGLHSVGGSPFPGMAGIAPQPAPPAYNLGQRMGNAAGFFANNTAMMKDPVTGNFLDPQAAQQAQQAQQRQQANGPDLIQKFMNYIHTKAKPSSFA